MKTVITMGFLVILAISCKKENSLTYPESIRAGQTSGDGVKYTDVIPDDTISGFSDSETKLLDINADGIDDFKLESSHVEAAGFGNGGSWITPLGSNQIVVENDSSYNVDTLSYNSLISENMPWQVGKCLLYNSYYSEYGFGNEGLWHYATEKYIGIKIYVDEKILYGWIREEISVVGSQKLMEYAITSGY